MSDIITNREWRPLPDTPDTGPDPANAATGPDSAPVGAATGHPGDGIFPVPGGETSYTVAARKIFGVIAKSRTLFIRGPHVHEVSTDATGNARLHPVDDERFCSLIENFGHPIKKLEWNKTRGCWHWRAKTMPKCHAEILLRTDAARDLLPGIRQLAGAPVLVPGPEGPVTLGGGWHEHGGGTFVTSPLEIPEVPLDTAVRVIRGMLRDFDFPTPGDHSRAVAGVISPALKMGGWIDDDFPLDLAEADQSQSGKTYRQLLTAAVYGETPSLINNRERGTGSLDEEVAHALIAGRPFILLDNMRGRIDSQLLESAIRGAGQVNARGLRVRAEVDCRPFMWMLSTNGAELTRDLANRSVITKIRKRSADHPWTEYQEGDILAHIRANRGWFLGAVHAIVRTWAAAGCPRTGESRHDFRAWSQSQDWIVRNIFGLAPLLDGHREEQVRTGNPRLQWLRGLAMAVAADGLDGGELHARELEGVCGAHELMLMRGDGRSAVPDRKRIGTIMAQLYREARAETIAVDGYTVVRAETEEYDEERRKLRTDRSYRFLKPGATA